MNTVLANLASHITGIGTPNYFYMSEAVLSVVNTDTSAAMVERLASIQGHKEIIEECSFPTDEMPDDFLYRLSQSSAYHRRLVAHQDISQCVFKAFRDATGIPFTDQRLIDPNPSAQARYYDASSIDIRRGLEQLYGAFHCYYMFAKLPEPEDDFANQMDIYQPQLHFLISAWMLMEGLQYNFEQGVKITKETHQWFEFIVTLFPAIRNSLERLKDNLHSIQGGVLAMAATGEKNAAVFSGSEKDELVGTILGLDKGISAFAEYFLKNPRDPAQTIGTLADSIRKQTSLPLLERFRAISEGRSY